MTYENPWTFDGEPFDDEDARGFAGFVYLITNTVTGKKYVGRKYFERVRKQRGKKRRARSESDWKNYYSSSEKLKTEVEEVGKSMFKREILSIHVTRGMVNFSEIVEQFNRNVLEDEDYINDTIGKWRRIPEHICARSIYSASSRRSLK